MKKQTRKPDRAAVAQSLRALEKLFGKRPPENGSAPRQRGAVGTLQMDKLTSRGAE